MVEEYDRAERTWSDLSRDLTAAEWAVGVVFKPETAFFSLLLFFNCRDYHSTYTTCIENAASGQVSTVFYLHVFLVLCYRLLKQKLF